MPEINPESPCPCGSGSLLKQCCGLYLYNGKHPETAVKLMRSRYTSYVLQAVDYLLQTTAVRERRNYSRKALLHWAESSHWLRLEILETTETTVTFKAYYLDEKLNPHVHFEKSRFVFEQQQWFYLDGKLMA